jgi:hypothetical protein
MTDPNSNELNSNPQPAEQMSAAADVTHMGETIVAQVVKDSIRRGVPAQQILEEYRNKGPQANAAPPMEFGPSLKVKHLGFWAKLRLKFLGK